MDFVEPIRDKKKIKDLKTYLMGQGNMRNYCLISFGINSAFRISDILKLTWDDVLDDNYKIKDYIYTRENKTNKEKKQKINASANEAFKLYLKSIPKPDRNDYIFVSRQGDNKPIGRRMAWLIIKESCAGVGIRENIGTHTMRKTWAYWAYRSGLDMAGVMQALNHSSIAVTKRYIGITQDEVDDAYDRYQL